MARVEEVICMLDKVSASAATSDSTKLEIAPILVQLVMLGPGNDDHPAARKLFNWLTNPRRTGEEFAYAVGELGDEVYSVMEEHFLHYVIEEGECQHLCRVAVQALAARCPVLEGPWEQAAWALLIAIDDTSRGSFSGDRLSAWVIHVIADPGICPNPKLRFELMKLLHRMDNVRESYITQAITSVLFACSTPNIEYLAAGLNNFHGTSLLEITQILEALAEGGQVSEFDGKLAVKLLSIQNARRSAVLHDVGYRCGMYPSMFTEPRELNGIIALVKTTTGWVRRTVRKEQPLCIVYVLKEASEVLHVLLNSFKATTCHTPQLMDLVASCIMEIVESLLKVDPNMVTGSFYDKMIYEDALCNIDKLLTGLPGRIMEHVSCQSSNSQHFILLTKAIHS